MKIYIIPAVNTTVMVIAATIIAIQGDLPVAGLCLTNGFWSAALATEEYRKEYRKERA